MTIFFCLNCIFECINGFNTLKNEMNLSLEEEVTKQELKESLFSMRNGKSLGPNRVTVEFFKAFYDLLKEDLLLIIR
jgi:hypothetical protein